MSALDGIVVIDLTGVPSGPPCTKILADFGRRRDPDRAARELGSGSGLLRPGGLYGRAELDARAGAGVTEVARARERIDRGPIDSLDELR